MGTVIEMAPKRFWQLIGSNVVVKKNGGIDANPLIDFLSTLSAAEILAFERRCSSYFADSRTWRLWGAAYLIHGGAPDDTFDYFRSWLIGRGRTVYESALKNPDTLADVATPEAIDDVVYSAGQTAYESVTQEDIPESKIKWPKLVKDLDFADTELMARLYPRLSKKFGG